MTDTPNGAMQVDVDLVKQLAELLDDTHLTEIEVSDGDRRIRVVRKAAAITAPVMQAAPAPAPAAAPAPVATAPAPLAIEPADHPGVVKSPMVGTAYMAAEPGSKPFATIGQSVAAGDTLLIVEAMKVMNPIVAPRAGTVRQLFVDNGQPVEFDQPLAIVE
ncbi:acetyl-CoA carboxylase biotin carboxyl carrier protein [Sphingomonas montana]|uniref:acetyl-CoA carboxylase biotin carboxyl carrier protein n=1 Tax=Sphingomonas montana TaxID=1843236 RepID=UPI00096F089A|nr:acetyl-CoA carboxylase biotin carboxyl carrier protein [Sphingomonas montana]